ncbi:MAG: SMI1/KNR4 family protein [Planctomycetes bacterium]|nr:SMI1/KNR4 family protein [Planctomycetota bacterium]
MKKLRALVLGGGHQWDGDVPASPGEMADLIAWSPVPLPAEYLELLRLSNGGHASLAGYPSYSRIWPAQTAIESNQDYEVPEWVPGFVAFGDDGGEVLIGFDTRAGSPYPVRAVPFVPMAWSDATDVAGDFKEFIGRLLPSG